MFSDFLTVQELPLAPFQLQGGYVIPVLCVLIIVLLVIDIIMRIRISRRLHHYQSTNDRQAQVLSTCMHSCQNVTYPSLGLCEEAAELMEKLMSMVVWNPSMPEDKKKFLVSWIGTFIQAGKQIGKFAKEMRHTGVIYYFIPQLPDTATVLERAEHDEKLRKIRLEVGDVKWMSEAVDFYTVYRAGVTLDKHHPATSYTTNQMNYAKLSYREKENTIDGKGDEKRTHIINFDLC